MAHNRAEKAKKGPVCTVYLHHHPLVYTASCPFETRPIGSTGECVLPRKATMWRKPKGDDGGKQYSLCAERRHWRLVVSEAATGLCGGQKKSETVLRLVS
jgi:hypothetical protein